MANPSMENTMNVGELKKLLEKYPDDMTVLKIMYSDYCELEAGDFSVEKAVPQTSYFMRSHPTMSEANKAKEAEFLVLVGN